MEAQLKDKLQDKLNKYFNVFLNVKINGASVYILPLKNDIPKIDNIKYSKEADMVEIIFEFQAGSKRYIKSDYNKNILLVTDQNGKVIGIQVFNIKELASKNMSKEFSLWKKGIHEDNIPSNTTPREIVENNYTERKLKF